MANLVRDLAQYGVESIVVAAVDGDEGREYRYGDCEVFRYAVPEALAQDEIRGRAPPQRFDEFRQLLGKLRPDIYHQHSWTRGCGGFHLEAAAELGLPTVLTIHMPSVFCARGTMMLFGREACDGVVSVRRCGACYATARGLPEWAARGVGGVVSRFLGWSRSRLGSPWRQADQKLRDIEVARNRADMIVVPSDWLSQALGKNGVPATQLRTLPQGASGIRTNDGRVDASGLRLGYLGRLSPEKGIDFLIRVFRRVRNSDAKLRIAGPVQDLVYARLLRRLAAGDSRISIEDVKVSGGVTEFLEEINVLAVPSRCLETGPLVVLEAFASGVPVIGSRLGGIKERVTDGIDGILLPHADLGAWLDTIEALASDSRRIAKLRANISPPPSTDDVASMMEAIYRDLQH